MVVINLSHGEQYAPSHNVEALILSEGNVVEGSSVTLAHCVSPVCDPKVGELVVGSELRYRWKEHYQPTLCVSTIILKLFLWTPQDYEYIKEFFSSLP
jgi:hypothetical protein